MKDAFRTTYSHYILCENEPLSQQHYLFSKGSISWCRHQRDQVEKITTYSHDKCLPPVFRSELKPLFTRLSDTKLIQTCLKD